MKPQKKAMTMDDYLKTSSINSMKLIRLVRSHEELYNSAAEGYNDKSHKDAIWERINQGLFPKYNSSDAKIKNVVRVNVRRRWKTLRNSIAREIKKTATLENYCRKKESPIMSELEFLIPHIKSIYGKSFSEEMGLREQGDNSVSNDEPTADEAFEEDLDEELIDLTDEVELKPFIKMDTSFHSMDSAMDEQDNMASDMFYPTVQINTSAHTHGVAPDSTESNDVNRIASTTIWNNEYCSVAQYKEGEFTNSTVLCTDHDNDENTNPPVSTNCEDAKLSSPSDTRKRPRSDTDDPTELQGKILQLLSNLERRERVDARLDQEAHDEDRMFLLSLVSDLKRVPASKKMVVKAEIATSIAKAIQ